MQVEPYSGVPVRMGCAAVPSLSLSYIVPWITDTFLLVSFPYETGSASPNTAPKCTFHQLATALKPQAG